MWGADGYVLNDHMTAELTAAHAQLRTHFADFPYLQCSID